MDAAEEFGIPKTKDFNTGVTEGCGYFQVTEKNGLRCSTAVGYLNPVKKRKNLKIVTRAHVKNIEFENNKAIAVNYWINKNLIKAKANTEIILSAGSIGSPHILQASGVGPGNLLKKYNINIVKEHPFVGKNLHDHLMLRPVYKVKNIYTLNKLYHSYFEKIKLVNFFFLERGPLTMGANQLCGFKSDENLATPNLQYHVAPMSTDKLGCSSS